MNELLKKHFTEEEFIELRDGKTAITQSYLDGGSYIKNTIKKSLGIKKVSSTNYPKYKREFPGGPLILIEKDMRVVEDNITLSHTILHNEHLWILKLVIDTTGWSTTSGIIPFETDYSTGWTRISGGMFGTDIYFGVGDIYGELKPYSQSIKNSNMVDNIQVGDVFVHLMNYHCLYIREKKDDDGVLPAKFKCEQWGFNSFYQRDNDIIPTPDKANPIHYVQDVDMEELDILNMYCFFMKSKRISTDLKDYFGNYVK